MARLQILELPTEHHGDDMVTPFVLVVDQHQPLRYIAGLDMEPEVVDEFEGVAEKIGARAVLVFMEAVEIPANGTVAQADDPSRIVDETSTCRPTHPDGTPYNYSEIVAEGWQHCDGCRTWGQWTAENPHDCPAPIAAHTPDA